jgi:nucleotidyltransferase/DNA polymerase involved in DNA repair
MDAFYASVEQRDNPALKGKPVAVGYPAKCGVAMASSYEARRFGVRSAMPSTIAMRKCAPLVFIAPRFDVYRAVSQQIQAIFKEYTPLVEPLSLDEAHLRRNRQSQRHPDGVGDGQGNPSAHLRGDRAQPPRPESPATNFLRSLPPIGGSRRREPCRRAFRPTAPFPDGY